RCELTYTPSENVERERQREIRAGGAGGNINQLGTVGTVWWQVMEVHNRSEAVKHGLFELAGLLQGLEGSSHEEHATWHSLSKLVPTDSANKKEVTDFEVMDLEFGRKIAKAKKKATGLAPLYAMLMRKLEQLEETGVEPGSMEFDIAAAQSELCQVTMAELMQHVEQLRQFAMTHQQNAKAMLQHIGKEVTDSEVTAQVMQQVSSITKSVESLGLFTARILTEARQELLGTVPGMKAPPPVVYSGPGNNFGLDMEDVFTGQKWHSGARVLSKVAISAVPHEKVDFMVATLHTNGTTDTLIVDCCTPRFPGNLEEDMELPTDSSSIYYQVLKKEQCVQKYVDVLKKMILRVFPIKLPKTAALASTGSLCGVVAVCGHIDDLDGVRQTVSGLVSGISQHRMRMLLGTQKDGHDSSTTDQGSSLEQRGAVRSNRVPVVGDAADVHVDAIERAIKMISVAPDNIREDKIREIQKELMLDKQRAQNAIRDHPFLGDMVNELRRCPMVSRTMIAVICCTLLIINDPRHIDVALLIKTCQTQEVHPNGLTMNPNSLKTLWTQLRALIHSMTITISDEKMSENPVLEKKRSGWHGLPSFNVKYGPGSNGKHCSLLNKMLTFSPDDPGMIRPTPSQMEMIVDLKKIATPQNLKKASRVAVCMDAWNNATLGILMCRASDV
ncbi:hypothetical protein CYMTET_15556, partial [Cymbomonas tetramitiformis]